jgi:hypothetical protein
MSISLKEDRGKLIVTGPYNEMKDVYPKLKTRGFSYDGATKAWWIDVSKLTPAKRKNIETLIRGGKGVEAPVTQESKEAQREAWKELAKDLEKTKLYAIQVQINNPYFFILHIGGDTYPIRDLIKSHGGKWENRYWELDLSKVPEAKARDLFKELEKVSKQRAVRAALIEDRIGSKPRVWPNCKTTLYVADGGIATLKMTGYNLSVKKLIDQYLSEAKAGSDAWRASTYNLSDSDVKHFIEGMDEQEVIEEKKLQEGPSEDKTVTPTERKPEQVPEKGRTNRKPGHCNKCRGWVEVGEGTLHGYFDDDEEKMTYYVEHRDRSVCESNIAMAKAVAEKGRSRSLALANLRKIICTGPNFVDPPAQGFLNPPQGERFEISASGYGGGNSVVVEPGERHVWFIQGNSADGDDWGRNNIGGHSMGWRTDLTDEIRGLIEVVVDRKIWSS